MIVEINQYYLPTLYMVVYLLAMLSCFIIKTKTSYLTILVLSAMAYAGWNDSLWFNAENLAIYELFVLSAMFFAFDGKFGTRLMFLTFAMIMVNSICFYFNVYDLYRLSGINLLFLAQCVITIKASYNTHKLREYRRRLGHGFFWAFEDNGVSINKMVQ